MERDSESQKNNRTSDPLVGKDPAYRILAYGHPEELKMLQYQVGRGWISPLDAAPRFRELIEQDPRWLPLFEQFGDSPKYFPRILAALYPDIFLSYSDLYRITASINIGSSTRRNFNFRTSLSVPDLPPVGPAAIDEVQGLMSEAMIELNLQQFGRDPMEVMKELELRAADQDEFFRIPFTRALQAFEQMLNLRIPAFKDKYQPRPYQARAILKGIQEGVDAKTAIGLFHGPRTGKTLTSLARMEYLGVQKALILAPAGLKTHWLREINEYYKTPPRTLILESPREDLLEQIFAQDTRFVISSYDLLVRNRVSMVDQLFQRGFLGLIADEAHLARNFLNNTHYRASVLQRLAHGDNTPIRHLILSTATPIDKVRDMSFFVYLLDPTHYPKPTSFSEQLRDNPRLGHNALLPLIDRQKTEDVLKIPEPQVHFEKISLNPTQRALYDWILEQETMHPFEKIHKLMAARTNPHLVKDIVIAKDLEKAKMDITNAFMQWKKESAKDNNLPFDSNFLVTYGFVETYIWALCNLKGGLPELVKETFATMVTEAWKGEPVPSKFIRIKEIVRERLELGEKVIITSGFFTAGIIQELTEDETEEAEFQSLLKYLEEEFGEDAILKIDGTDGTETNIVLGNNEIVSEREIIRRRWKDKGEKKILLISARASGQGIDLSIQDPKVTGVSVIFESLPLSYPLYTQVKARVLSDTQLSPVHFFYLEAKDTFDGDIRALLDQKGGYEAMLLDAVSLKEEELEIFEKSPMKLSERWQRTYRSPLQNMTLIFGQMLGKSAQENRNSLQDKFNSEYNVADYLATYYRLYENGLSGQMAQVIKQVVEGIRIRNNLADAKIADWGSGPLILARTLKEPVYSLDLSKTLLESGREKMKQEGIDIPDQYLVEGSISAMPKNVFSDNSFDIGVCSLALDCTRLGEERLQAIKEMRRSLKPGGFLIITVPANELDAVEFHEFLKGFQELGFIDHLLLSGFVKGETNNKVVSNGWLFVLKKTDDIWGEGQESNFTFSFDKEKSSSVKKEEKRRQDLIRRRFQRSPHVDDFYIYAPDARESHRDPGKWDRRVSRSIREILSPDSVRSQVLEMSEEVLEEAGYKREIRSGGGEEGIHLTRI